MRLRYRAASNQRYCQFSIKGGQEIRFVVYNNGKPTFQTSWIKITDNSLFDEKNNIIFSVFESTTTVIVNDTVILNIDETPEESGEAGLIFYSHNNETIDLKIKNLSFSTDVINFEPILEMPKNPAVYFMHANDFYEQGRYELALVYYRKGLLFGNGDHKIYNRMGNLFFMIEEYQSALSYYFTSMKSEPDRPEYNVNYTRTLCRLERIEEADLWFRKCTDSGYSDNELIVDYSAILIKKNKLNEAVTLLRSIESKAEGMSPFHYRIGKALIDTGEVSEGKKHLYKAAKIISKNDPSSAAIILKYSIDRIPDGDSVKLLCSLLREKKEFKSIYELVKSSRVSVEIDEQLFDYLIESEIESGLFTHADEEFKKYSHLAVSNTAILLRARILFAKTDYQGALELIEQLVKIIDTVTVNKNTLILFAIRCNSKLNIFNESDKLIEKLEPDNADYYQAVLEYGMLLVDFGQYELALEVFSKVENNFKDDGEFFYNRGLAYMGLNNYLSAKQEFLTAYKLTDKHPSISMELATAFFYSTDYHEGIAVLAENYDNMPDDGRKDNLYANLLMSLNKVAEAQRYYYHALEVDPENEEYGLNLAESFYRLKDYENAMMIVKQIIKKDKMDRAKALYMKLKSHLYDTIGCSGCDREWDFPKNAVTVKLDPAKIDTLSEDSPAGNCPVCGVVYCVKCAGKGKQSKCLRCGGELNYDLPGI